MISTSCLSFLLLLAGVGAECPPSWTNGGGDSCYRVSRTPMKWVSAQQFCRDNGGHLAEILSAEEEARIDSFLPSDLDYWIGLSDSATEGTWRWLESHREAEYTNWGPEQPDNSISNNPDGEDCAAKWGNDAGELWNDFRCEAEGIHALCQVLKEEEK